MGKKILLIDDEPHILIMVSNRLRANGYEVTTALSGDQGIERAAEDRPDLILLDYLMPEMSGAEVLHRLKNDPETKKIPVIILTVDVKKVKVFEFQMRGAAAVIFKPFTSDELLRTIAVVLGANP